MSNLSTVPVPLLNCLIRADNGTAVVPTISFQNSPGNGFFLKDSGTVGLAIGGTELATWSSTGPVAVGVTTNSDAAAGVIGEYMQASRLKSAATGATSTTSLNVATAALVLTAGDWDVSGVVVFLPAAGTSVTLLKAAISKTTATLPATDTIGVPTSGEVSAQLSTAANVMAGDVSVQMPTCRISLAGTTNIFLVANATFSVSTLTVYGSLNARRVR